MSPSLPVPPRPASSDTPSVSPSAVAQATASPTAAPVPRITGDLDTGAATHVLPAGGASLVVDYWTAQDPRTWTAATEGVVQLSAHLEGTSDELVTLVSRFTATATAPDGTRSVLADDRGEFVLTPPFSYGTALTVPASPGADPARPAALEVGLQWDLLVETAPESGRFFRQTVVDQLTIALAADPAARRTATAEPTTEPTTGPTTGPTARLAAATDTDPDTDPDTDGAPR